MQETGFRWWIERIRHSLTLFDIVRLDHFRGFSAYWEVKSGSETAKKGRWVKAPGYELFNAVKKEFGDLPFIAEDLGIITPNVEKLRDDFNLPGMKVLQFAFGGDAHNAYLPHNHRVNSVFFPEHMKRYDQGR